MRVELDFIEKDYRLLVNLMESVFREVSKEEKTDPRLYWLAGNALEGFLERLDALGFYLVQQTATLSRDFGVSASFIRRLVSFRKRFPDFSKVNPGIPWVKYRDGGNPASPASG